MIVFIHHSYRQEQYKMGELSQAKVKCTVIAKTVVRTVIDV